LLRSKHIKHAVLDVFEKEPLPKDHPFWSSKNITILPHISALTNFETASDVVKKNILVFKKSGKIPESVNIKIGY
jgi:glyoxylate/hydroxypyruvate reductase A